MVDKIDLLISILIAILTGGVIILIIELLHLHSVITDRYYSIIKPFIHKLTNYENLKDSILTAAKVYLADNRYPIAVINIEVDPYLVDVNVHPSKLEVRFSKEHDLRDLIYNGVSDTLNQVNLTYQVKNKVTERETFKPQLEQFSFDLTDEKPIVNEFKEVYKPEIKQEYTIDKKEYEEPVFEQSLIKERTVEYSVKEQTPVYKEVVKPLKEKIYAKVQIHGTYLIGENEKGMYLLDQHAAQERINYEFMCNVTGIKPNGT